MTVNLSLISRHLINFAILKMMLVRIDIAQFELWDLENDKIYSIDNGIHVNAVNECCRNIANVLISYYVYIIM